MVAKTLRSILIVSLFLTGCQVISTQPAEDDVAVSGAETSNRVEDIASSDASRQQKTAEIDNTNTSAPVVAEPKIQAPAEPEPSPEQVVIKLQQQALQLQSEGRWSEAELILARALRIDANKVDLYHQMATVRMGQKRFAEAEQIAMKGLTLTNQTADHKALLWEVIAQCRSAMSDVKGAREARSEMLKWMNYD